MEFVKQTKHGEEGNCLEACVASLFGGDIGTLNCCSCDDETWLIELSQWFKKEHNKFVVSVEFNTLEECVKTLHETIVITTINSGHESPLVTRHAVLSSKGVIIFDPNIGETNIKLVEEMEPLFLIVGDIN